MSFPDDLLDMHVEVFLGGVWVGLTDRMLLQDIAINHGRSDESSQAAPSSVQLQFLNEDGWLTEKDPRSPWWPYWGKNTPLRIWVDSSTTGILLNGEVSEIVPEWPVGDLSAIADADLIDLSTLDEDALGIAYVNVTVSGILRRLGQGTRPLRSPIHRLVTSPGNLPNVSDYWPMEDGTDSDHIASGLLATASATPHRMAFTGLQMSSDSSLPGSDPLPTVASGGEAQWSALVDGPPGDWVCEMVGVRIPEAPDEYPQLVRLMQIETTGTIVRWFVDVGYELDVDEHSYIRVTGVDASGVQVVRVAKQEPNLFGEVPRHVRLRIRQVGGDVHWAVSWATLTEATDVSDSFGAVAVGQTRGRPTLYSGGVSNGPSGGVTVGHVIFHADIANGWLVPADSGWIGETARNRAARLCGEEGVPFTSVFRDSTSEGAAMGAQRSAPLMALLEECAAADLAILCESRAALAVVFRTCRSRYNRDVLMTLDASEIINPFTPTFDDQRIRNDITVQRIGGSKFRRVDPVSTQDPPDGVGVYEDSPSLSLATDAQLEDQAGWRLHLGTDDSVRYPQITFDLAAIEDDTRRAELIAAWKTVRVGTRIRVENLPPQHPLEFLTGGRGVADVIVEGWTENPAPFGPWPVTANCSPAAPWQVATWEESRYSPASAVLATGVDADDTALSVTSSELWSTTAPPFDLTIGDAEVVTVTAISGASQPQTFTVVRDVNRLGRAHSAGATVALAVPAVAAL